MKRLNTWWAWCLGALLLGVVLGWASPPPPLPKRAPVTDDWALPEDPVPSRALPAEARSAVQAVRWDGEEAGSGAEGPWRLAGVATGPVALIQTLSDKKILRLARGDSLPGDATLLHIGHDRIRIERGGCELVYQLYRSDPISAEGQNCPEVPSSEASAAQPANQSARRRSRRR